MTRTTSGPGSVNDDLALLPGRVIFVRKDPGKRIGEHQSRFGETHTTFFEIRSIFALVPFENERHSCLPTAYEIDGAGSAR